MVVLYSHHTDALLQVKQLNVFLIKLNVLKNQHVKISYALMDHV